MFGKGLWVMSHEEPDYNKINGYTSSPTTYTISSVSDANTFCNRFNNASGYKDSSATLHLGDKITIKDGTYNKTWVVAGFDMEHNQVAADGTTYDNGYGICLLPIGVVTTSKYYTDGSDTNYYYSYIVSNVHMTVIPAIISKLQTVLGSHLVERNVLLSSRIELNGSEVDENMECVWTKSYGTLLATSYQSGDINGQTVANIGEATYALPVFNYTSDYSVYFSTYTTFFFRCMMNGHNVYIQNGIGVVKYESTGGKSRGIRPMIYIR